MCAWKEETEMGTASRIREEGGQIVGESLRQGHEVKMQQVAIPLKYYGKLNFIPRQRTRRS